MPSIRQITNDCLPFKIFVFSHFGLYTRALKRWCVFKSAQCTWQSEMACINVLEVWSSFGVWRFSFMSPHFRVGSNIVLPRSSVCFVCPSQNHDRSVTWKGFKISSWNFNIRRCAERKNHNSWINIFSYAPLNFVSCSFSDKIVSALYLENHSRYLHQTNIRRRA